jgi:hypothetical protein
LDGVLAFTLYTLPFAYFAELVLGVPVWLAFKYFRVRSFSAFAAGGAFVGLLFCAIWDWPAQFTLQSLAQAFDPVGLALFVILASAFGDIVSSNLVFWPAFKGLPMRWRKAGPPWSVRIRFRSSGTPNSV